MTAVREQLGLDKPEVRAIHAKVFTAMIDRYFEDRRIDLRQADNLHDLWNALATLGWAPGEKV